MSDFPNLKIEMHVGMALQGISQRDHDLYRKISDNGAGEIYYVDKLPMVHQKILEFYDGQEAQNIDYVGSANFSYSGFGTLSCFVHLIPQSKSLVKTVAAIVARII